jgi:hypothetical protein
MDDREQRAREALRKAKLNLPWMLTKEGNQQWFRHHLSKMDPTFLVAAAREGDADAIELLREYARGARRAGMNVPTDLLEFVWEYFIDGKPAAKSGSSPKDSSLRNQYLAMLVHMMVTDYGFPETRNPEYRNEGTGPMTACRLVAEEFGFGERWIEEIWRDRKAGILKHAQKRTG